MTCVTTQKQKDNAGREKGPGPLTALLMLFCNLDATAELFRKVRWVNGLACPTCGKQNVVKYCRYGHFQRYTCKDCNITFNDKTGTILHYKQVNLGEWMLAVWMYSTRSHPHLVHAQHVVDLACLTLEKVGGMNACDVHIWPG